MTRDQELLAHAVWEDLVQTYPTMSLDYVMQAARDLVDGRDPKNVASVFVKNAWERAGIA